MREWRYSNDEFERYRIDCEEPQTHNNASEIYKYIRHDPFAATGGAIRNDDPRLVGNKSSLSIFASLFDITFGIGLESRKAYTDFEYSVRLTT